MPTVPSLPTFVTPQSQPTPPVSEPMLPSIPPELPKTFPKWIIIGIILLLLAATSVFAYKYYQLKQPTFNPQPTPTPQTTNINPSPTPDPTANWKTYTNDEFKFSLRHPNSWDTKMLGSDNSKTLIIAPQDTIVKLPNEGFGGGSFLTLSVNFYKQPQSTPKTDESQLISQVSSITLDHKPAQRYTTQILQDLPGFSKGDVIDTVVIENNGLYLKIDFMKKEYKTIFDQILSTFKFTEENQSKIDCKDPRPEVCTMECIQNPPYICGSDGRSYCTVCQACANKSVAWYEMKTSACGEFAN